MNNNDIFVGLDVGSSIITCMIGSFDEERNDISIIGLGKSVSRGVRKGVIFDSSEVAHSINMAIDEAERMSGHSVESVCVNVSGSHIKSVNSKGVIAVGGVDREITEEDLQRVQDAAMVIQLPTNREIIQIYPRKYRLDGQDDIKDPLGMSGVRLEVDAHLITASTPAMKGIQAALSQAGVMIDKYVITSLAAARSVLKQEQREHGAAIVDIGSATTSIAIFDEGEVLQTTIIPVGSGHITNDLAIGLRAELEVAEDVKLKFANIADHKISKNITIKQSDNTEITVDQDQVDSIVEARLEELFNLINRDLSKVHKSGKLPGGIVLTGGGAKLPHIDTYAKNILKLPVKIGSPNGISGVVEDIEDSSLAVAIGLMYEHYSLAHNSPSYFSKKINISKATGLIGSIFKRLKP